MKRNGLTRESHDSQMIFSQKPLNRRFFVGGGREKLVTILFYFILFRIS